MTQSDRRFIEETFPVKEVSQYSAKEKNIRHGHISTLHIWWARRPLAAMRAAIFASLVPAPDTDEEREELEKLIATIVDWDQVRDGNSPKVLEARQKVLDAFHGRPPRVLDPFAGGGSIPFEAIRYGLNVIANELNPVAAVILKATLDYPARFGEELVREIKKWGERWYEQVKPKLEPFFTPLPPNIEGAAYLWARTVACPTTGKPVPLSPNWWLSKGSKPVAVRLRTDPAWDEPHFEIVAGDAIDFDPN